jgi:hypothetical protein
MDHINISNRIGRRLQSRDDDLTAVSKGIYDSVMEKLSKELKGSEAKLLMTLGPAVKGQVDDLLTKRLESEVTKRFEGEYHKRLEFLHGEYQSKAIQLEREYQSKMVAIEGFWQSKMATAEKEFAQRVDFIQQAHQQMWQQFAEFMRDLPVPNVQVAVPQQAAPQVHVSVPETPAPVINLPEMKPEVNVTVPQPRLIEKEHIYDEHGRPVKTIERAREGT